MKARLIGAIAAALVSLLPVSSHAELVRLEVRDGVIAWAEFGTGLTERVHFGQIQEVVFADGPIAVASRGGLDASGVLTLNSGRIDLTARHDIVGVYRDVTNLGGSIDISALDRGAITLCILSIEDRSYPIGTILVRSVPEPDTYVMVLAALGFIGLMTRRRRSS
ncbi:MAG: PEP-CTERM sorting domain-containing protein [Rhodoferax sp.]|nr:PEP-CTERM sorting domain-containing protein [Rhodoferax sp.]